MTEPTSGPVGPLLLGELLDRLGAALELFARQYCDCPEDVVQEAFVALAGLPRCPDNPRAWLYHTVRQRALEAARKRRRRKVHEASAAQNAAPWFVASPEDEIDAQGAATALAALPDECREVVVAHIWGGLTFKEIAQFIRATDSTAHRRYQEGLRLLRQKLGDLCLTNPKKN